jgi:CheY-like chemotaxis protein
VVDDDAAVLGFVAHVLRGAGAEVTAVTGGREALRAVADGTSKPQVLLTDIDMPVMTGIELAARIAALRPGIRIVMMTGDPASAALARERPEQVAMVLTKPVSIADLLETTGLAEDRPDPA